MTPALHKTYRLRNGTVGLVEEALESGDFYGVVTAPGTDMRVKVIWKSDGAAKMRNDGWDLVDEMPQVADDVDEFVAALTDDQVQPSDLSRIASALERIADYLENQPVTVTTETGQ